jgi:hypothetical protein
MMCRASCYTLKRRTPNEDVFDSCDRDGAALHFVAAPPPAPTNAPESTGTGAEHPIWQTILRVKLLAWLFVGCIVCVRLLGWLLGHRSPKSIVARPRLIVRLPGDGKVIFTLRQSSGMMYDSRRLYDETGLEQRSPWPLRNRKST